MQTLLKAVTVIVLVLMLTAAPIGAAGGKFQILDAGWDLGSLISHGTVGGLGNTDVTINLLASGIPSVTCTNQGGNQSPGQNPVKVSSSGEQTLDHNSYTKNGKSPFGVTAPNPEVTGTPTEMGCANDNWVAAIDFVFWTDAIITITDSLTGAILNQQAYVCVTTRFPAAVSCTPVP